MNRRSFVILVLATSMLAGPGRVLAQGDRLTVSDRRWQLGRPGDAEWATAVPRENDGWDLELTFNAHRNDGETTLFIRQDDVRHDWFVEINGRRLGRLFLMEADLVSTLGVPAGVLRDGRNQLRFVPPAAGDDIVVGEMWMKPGDPRSAIDEATLRLRVTEEPEGRPVPARITIVNSQGTLVPLSLVTNQGNGPFAAVRPGVVYAGTLGAVVGLPAGEYTAYASRGFEYGVHAQTVRLVKGETKTLEFALRREVATPGWVGCDTHVHTLTHSGHGDATLDERLLTLAGEGIELPIATDHNHHADYREPTARQQLGAFLTPVTGNEVTTGTAHFNIFPVQPSARVVDFRIGGGSALTTAMRSTPDVRVVVLNHPLNIHNGFQPFAPTNFNIATGEHRGGPRFSFDALEVLSSSAQQSDYLAVFRGWFALLNQGARITGVGSSDGHDVSRYIIGQSRTYLAVGDSDPGRIDVERACDALLAGRALVSMGLLVDLKVNDAFGVGDLATDLSGQIQITARVQGPSWVEATNLVVFANGRPAFQQRLPDNAGRAGLKAELHWRMPRPSHDVHLVAIATGPGVTAPYWAIPRPYQPTSKEWVGRVIGATNPVWLDADGDGRFTSARGYSQQLIDRFGTDPEKVIPSLAEYDEAVAAQLAGLLDQAGVSPASEQVRRVLVTASEVARIGFDAYSAAVAR